MKIDSIVSLCAVCADCQCNNVRLCSVWLLHLWELLHAFAVSAFALAFPLAKPLWLCARLAVGSLAAGCAAPVQEPLQLREQVVAVTAAHELLTFNAARPDHILERRPLQGLPAGDKLVGIDFRVARVCCMRLHNQGAFTRWSWAQASSPRGRWHTARGVERLGVWRGLQSAADRVRVVSNLGQNLRLHPDTGAQVDGETCAQGCSRTPTFAMRGVM